MSRPTLDTGLAALPFAYMTVTCYGVPFQILRLGLTLIMPVLNPESKLSVWPLALSLAAT